MHCKSQRTNNKVKEEEEEEEVTLQLLRQDDSQEGETETITGSKCLVLMTRQWQNCERTFFKTVKKKKYIYICI